MANHNSIRLILVGLLLASACNADMVIRGRGYRRAAAETWSRTGLIVEWLFASNANDTSGLGNNGTLYDGASVSSHSVLLDGDSDQVLINDNATMDAWTNELTVCAWINPSGSPPDSWSQIVGKWDVGTTEFTLLYGVTANKPQFYITLGAGAGTAYNSGVGSATISTGTWSFVVGRKTAANIEVWMNNSRQAYTAQAGNITLKASALRAGCIGASSRELQGRIDDVRIFKRALTEAEMTAIYNAGRSQ